MVMILTSRSDLVQLTIPRTAVGRVDKYAKSPKPISFASSSVGAITSSASALSL
jgi:hypothetical protein